MEVVAKTNIQNLKPIKLRLPSDFEIGPNNFDYSQSKGN